MGDTTASTETTLRLLYAVGRFHTVMRAELGRRLEGEGLTIAEFTALSVLGAGSGLSGAQLARRSLVSPQAMNQLLAALEDKGLITRAAASGLTDRSHHRARTARLTPAGRGALRRGERVLDGVEEIAFAPLSAAAREELADQLREGAIRLSQGS